MLFSSVNQRYLWKVGKSATSEEVSLQLVKKINGYLYEQSTNFKCSVDHAKRSFYRSANAIFGRVTSEDITLLLTSTQCIHILLYGLQ